MGTIFSGRLIPHSVPFECLMQEEGVCVLLRCFWTSAELHRWEEDDEFRFWIRTPHLLVCWSADRKKTIENDQIWSFIVRCFWEKDVIIDIMKLLCLNDRNQMGDSVVSDPHDCCDEICWCVCCVFWWGFVVLAGKANICCFFILIFVAITFFF